MEEKTGVIYKTTNLISGRFYVGKSERNDESYYGSGIKLKDAIKSYGKENFKKEIIEECSLDIIDEREKFWINFLKAKELGYNIQDGGEGQPAGENHAMFGKKHSEETRKKISEKGKGRKFSDEHKKKIAEATKRRDPELLKKFYEAAQKANIGRHPSEETRKKMSDNNSKFWSGKQMSYEMRIKMSAAKSKSFKATNKKTNQIIYGQILSDFCKEFGIDISTAAKCLKGKIKSKTTKGWYLEYGED